MKRYLKSILTFTIIAATIVAFIYYLANHPQTVTQLKHLPPGLLLILIVLYAGVFLALALITRASLHIFDKTMGAQENILFNAYSSLINFFGPGQSGPVFRGAYLKKRHQLGVRQYLFATLLYYGFFAVMSAFLAFAGVRPWWQTVLVVGAAGIASLGVIYWYKRRGNQLSVRLTLQTVGVLCGVTLLQVVLTTIIYGVELHNVGAHASIGQVMAYTGVANLALFVSITPGAIGIREAFLGLSQHLHHINGSTIVAANVVDRASYLVFLGILFLLVIVMHAKDKLHVSQLMSKKGE